MDDETMKNSYNTRLAILCMTICLMFPLVCFAGPVTGDGLRDPRILSALLWIISGFFLSSAFFNWDWAFSARRTLLIQKLVGRTGARLFFVAFGIFCVITAQNLTRANFRVSSGCGATSTYSFLDSDGECKCDSGYVWNDMDAPNDYQCIPDV